MIVGSEIDKTFLFDLNEATEAWYAYADRVFGPCNVEIDAALLDARYAGKGIKAFIRKNIENHRNSSFAWPAFTNAFLLARGHTYDPVKKTWNAKGES